jgi:hypothetical protein
MGKMKKVKMNVPANRECNKILKEIYGDERLVEQWWHRPLKEFEGHPPKSVDTLDVLEYISKNRNNWRF